MPSGSYARNSVRLKVIYNPTAGQRHRRRFQKTLTVLEQLGCSIELAATEHPGHATEIAAQVSPKKVDAVVAAGGDGTISEALEGLVGTSIPLGIIPVGTANVLAAELGIPSDAGSIAKILQAGFRKTVYAGEIESKQGVKRFQLMASVGLDAQVVSTVNPHVKKYLGKLSYVLQSLLVGGPGYKTLYHVEANGASYEAAWVVVAKGRYYGGRFVCAPEARLDEAEFQLCLCTRGGRWHALRYAVALVLGKLYRLSDVTLVKTKEVSISGPVGDPVQADGDSVATLPVTIRISEAPAELFAPARRN
jgi:diacylglycerol kinase (ATP)